ncbi:pre-mRNA-splicing factor ATP-dependent RNA helicase prp43 [Fusarium denticulatum]|uniref:Pre-mRNA-splicing factor ATP-dependent RNA helicase prp43 n=1 Tax=Fusarium denticulatum TaxID=48507 RepID=A0A8H5XJ06_9HYPO|nr:pre-mRNA-splicing factor ATP-dependent RNA helicase prp43 [Fusarium denticulatum]
MTTLKTAPISKASSRQRAEHEILLLKSLGYQGIPNFDWLDLTHPEAYLRAIGDLRDTPYQVRYAADVVKMAFSHPESDILGHMNALSCYWQMSKDLSEDELLGWCNEYFVNHRVATGVLAIRRQLLQHIEPKASAKVFLLGSSPRLQCSILPTTKYKTVQDNHPFGIDPHSGLVGYNHQWVICLKMHNAGIQYLQLVTTVEPEWPIEYSFFADDRLPKKFGGELRNPAVKRALDEALSRVQQSSQRV